MEAVDVADKLLSIAKVAEMLDISVTQIRRLVEWGHLPEPSHPAPKTARWFLSDVERYLVQLKHGALPPVPDKKSGK